MITPEVGAEMRRERLSLGLRQRDIAAAIGTTRAYVSAVERGVPWDPDADKLVLWARALELPDAHWLRRAQRLGRPVLHPAVAAQIRAAARDTVLDLLRPRAAPEREITDLDRALARAVRLVIEARRDGRLPADPPAGDSIVTSGSASTSKVRESAGHDDESRQAASREARTRDDIS